MTGDDNGLTPREARRADPGRLIAFTDGVFAIIITILVLELHAPDLASGQSLKESLAEIRPTLLAFVISFVLVGMYWVWHRGVFTRVRYVNSDVLWLNLLFLLPTAMIPFAASVLGENDGDATALHLYGAILIIVTLLRMVLDWYLLRHPGLMWEPVTAHGRRVAMSFAAMPLLVYAIAMLIASTLPGLSLALYLAMPLLYLAFVAILKTDPKTRQAAEDAS
jgi:uncharacterized membrane protein